jgi:hypothetical protein
VHIILLKSLLMFTHPRHGSLHLAVDCVLMRIFEIAWLIVKPGNMFAFDRRPLASPPWSFGTYAAHPFGV